MPPGSAVTPGGSAAASCSVIEDPDAGRRATKRSPESSSITGSPSVSV
jgi:hypothetical protein